MEFHAFLGRVHPKEEPSILLKMPLATAGFPIGILLKPCFVSVLGV